MTDERPPQTHVITVGGASFIVIADGPEAERLALEHQANANELRAALLHQLGDLHQHSTRPCSTCQTSRKALRIKVDKATMAGMLGCGYSSLENLAAWRLAMGDGQ